jgi:hypothetical protein
MGSLTKIRLCKLAVVLGYLVMVAVNGLAVMGKINGLTTAEVSDRYPSLFTPEPITFSIWGILYMLLLLYVMLHLFSKSLWQDGAAVKIACWFALSCVANTGWILAWHYGQIALSVLVMALLMICLARVLPLVSGPDQTFGCVLSRELPFGLYAGWITVATVANVASLLVSIGWNGFGIPDYLWMVLTLLIADAIAIAVTRKTLNVAYPAAVLWGLAGILARYTPDFRFDTGELWIVLTLALCMLALAAQWIVVIIQRLRKK